MIKYPDENDIREIGEKIKKVIETIYDVEGIEIEYKITPRGTEYLLRCNDKEKLPFIIGKGGKNIQRIKNAFIPIARQKNMRILLFVFPN